MENITARINEANNSINSRDIKHFSQDLNIKEVDLSESVRNAKGAINIKTLSKMYLIA